MEEGSWAVVAHSIAHAKKLLWGDTEYDLAEFCDNEYINLTCKWDKNHDVSDLPIGMVDNMIALKRGIYSSLIDEICPVCGKWGQLEYHEDVDVICCYECEEGLYQAGAEDKPKTEEGEDS